MSGPDLAHVVWLGGSACAGKSSVARLLAAEHDLALYSTDDHFAAHRERASPERHPHFRRLMDLPVDELWAPPPARQAADLLGFYADEFELVVEDLRVLPRTGRVIAEGVGLLPALVAPLLAAPGQALWLVATPELRRRLYPRRGAFVQELLARYPDPAAAFAAWMERDDLLAGRLAADAALLGLACLEIDGSQEVGAVAAGAARSFGLA